MSNFMKLVTLLLAALILASSPVVQAQERPRSLTFVPTPDEDPEMDAAIAKARADIDRFWKSFMSPQDGERDFAVKRKFSEGERWEYMWVTLGKRSDGMIFGTVANRPEGLRRVRLGQAVSFPESEVADWLYFRAGRMHGNYTLRPLLSRMPPAEAARARAMLAEP